MKLLLINQGHTQNYGDIAIAEAVMSNFAQLGYATEMAEYCDEEKTYGKILNNKYCRKTILKSLRAKDYFNRKRVKAILKKQKPDIAIIGGGELISSHIEFNSAFVSWVEELSKNNIPIYVTGVSGDINMPKAQLDRYGAALKKCSKIFVRDNATKANIKKAYGLSVEVYPDVVFSLKAKERLTKRNQLIVTPIAPNEKTMATLGVRNLDEYCDYYYQKIKNNYEKIIITPTVKTDEKISNELTSYLKAKGVDNVEFVKYTNLADFLKMLESSEKVISARMHAMILALLCKNEIEPIPFKEKLKTFEKEYARKDIGIKSIQEKSAQQFRDLLK